MKLRSDIDSKRFGYPVGKVYPITASMIESVLQESRIEGLRLLLARCPADDWTTVHALERHGFLLMDTLLYLRRTLDGTLPMPSGDALIRAVRPDESDVVSAVAREAFADYCGHYNTDTRLDRAIVAEIYPSWARYTVTDRTVADEVLVAEIDGKIIGFGALKAVGGGVCDGMLYAVAPAFRRRRVYQDLVSASLLWGRNMGFTAMDYSTQLTNVSAQRAMSQLGFVLDRSFYTFHLWYD